LRESLLLMIVNMLSCNERNMAVKDFNHQENGNMATAKKPTKTSPAKRPTPASDLAAAKPKPAPKTKLAAKPEPAAKVKASPKTAPAKAAPKKAAAAVARSRAKKAPAVSPEQRKYYVEVAAYHIAERRGFALGNPLEDWVQAEAEIDRLLAEGRLGS
jgi:hypothetical protein